jgi:catechol 2,3-dioxygenase-like lactoylglutathione lyase family enzyme
MHAMPVPNYVLLYVASPSASQTFYAQLLDLKAVESAPTFALFVMEGGLKLGLWRREDVTPPATATAGAAELCFSVADRAEVDRLHSLWAGRGVVIAQVPQPLDFGYTFTAMDPDGHRLRVFAPG